MTNPTDPNTSGTPPTPPTPPAPRCDSHSGSGDPRDLNCRECLEFLADYLDNSLPAPQLREFEHHLADCPPCIAYLDNYRQTIAISRKACDSGADCTKTPLPEALIKAIQAARKKQA
ncbi:MAG: zf-HC2 domain-containing protein [Phycisphaerales bacterium]|nr:zf-HC2 domain-containing protein [Phycisphaerales bacterium]